MTRYLYVEIKRQDYIDGAKDGHSTYTWEVVETDSYSDYVGNAEALEKAVDEFSTRNGNVVSVDFNGRNKMVVELNDWRTTIVFEVTLVVDIPKMEYEDYLAEKEGR